MSDPYIGEVRLVGFNFAPYGWQLCNGQLLPISDNAALFNLIGTTYGGDGQTTFALPDLRGRVPIHQGSGAGQSYVMGQMGGVEWVSIIGNTYPTHSHSLQESTLNQSPVANPSSNAVGGNLRIYTNQAPATAMSNAMISVATGGSQPHDNMQPYQAMSWIISLNGIYPTQS